MENENYPFISARTLEEQGNATFLNMVDFYIRHYPEKNQVDFEKEIFEPMLNGYDLGEHDYAAMLKSLPVVEQKVAGKFKALLMACSVYIEAGKASEKGDREATWSYMAEARYWCGVVMASVGLEDLVDETSIKARKSTAQQGGLVRAETFAEAKKLAFKLVREMQPKQNGWRSRLAAAVAITPEISKAKSEFRVPVGQNPEKTIYAWLEEMPDASEYFPIPKQGKKEKG